MEREVNPEPGRLRECTECHRSDDESGMPRSASRVKQAPIALPPPPPQPILQEAEWVGCEICRSPMQEDQILLCDSCDKGNNLLKC